MPSAGRPSKYKPGHCNIARKLCKIFGAINEQLAEFFEVNVDTIYEWQNTYTDFSDALKEGKQNPDDLVEQALFKKALGFEHPAVKIFNNNGEALEVEYKEKYAPDTAAAIFWLKNRRPEKWRQTPPEPPKEGDEELQTVFERGADRPSLKGHQ
jgi:hypothetical protein